MAEDQINEPEVAKSDDKDSASPENVDRFTRRLDHMVHE